jgi:zinc transport system substrate-binding protein
MGTRIVLSFALAAAALLGVAGCGGGSEDGQAPEPEVVAAFYPIAYLVDRIAPTVAVRTLTPPGAEPHDVELSARDAQALHDAELVLYVGGGFMPALEQAVEGDDAAVDLLQGADPHPSDPHAWLDPHRFAGMARRAAVALGDPDAADTLVAELEALDAEFRAGLASCERREIVTSHAAFGYLADRYGLEQVALTGISPEAEPSARAIERLVDDVREASATTVFTEPLVSPRLAETIAREANVQTAELDPLEGLTKEALDGGGDYFSVMRENLARLREALGCT